MGDIYPVSDVSNNTNHYNKEGSNLKKSTVDNNTDTTCLLGIFEIRQDEDAHQYELDQMKGCKKYTSIEFFWIGILSFIQETL